MNKNKNLKLVSTLATVLAGLGAAPAQAVTIPPAVFTTTVIGGGATTGICGINTKTSGTPTDGVCTAANGSFAHTDGGVGGTPGFDPGAPLGTSVSSSALAGTSSTANMIYYFSVGGPTVTQAMEPAGGTAGQIAVDIISSGGASLLGGAGLSFATLQVFDAGPDTPGAPDPDPVFLVDQHSDCVGGVLCSLLPGGAGAAWSATDASGIDHLCLSQGDTYAIVITASSTAGKGASASAFVDPKIIVDSQGPTDPSAKCYQPTNDAPFQDSITISGGTSTGVPEPSTLGLMGLGLFAIGLGRRYGRRVRQMP